MKLNLYKAALLFLLTALLAAICFFGWPQYVKHAKGRALHSVKKHEKAITSVEVLNITTAQESGPAGSYSPRYGGPRFGITAKRTLAGEQARELIRAWKRVSFEEDVHAGCHDPGFVLRFLSGDRAIFEVAVCFDCENVSFSPAPFESTVIQMYSSKYKNSGTDDLKALLMKLP